MRGSREPGGRARQAIADILGILARISRGSLTPSGWQRRQLRRWPDVISHLGRPDDPAWGRIAQVTVIAFWLDTDAVDEQVAEGPLSLAEIGAMVRGLERAALLHPAAGQDRPADRPERPPVPVPAERRREPERRTAGHGRDYRSTARLRGTDTRDR